MTDAFANVVSPILRHVVDFQARVDSGEHPPAGALRDQMIDLLAQADQRAGTSSQTAHDWEVARHAVVYWIDEVLINSRWNHADSWRQQILEWDFYRERLRADRFFEKATEAASYSGTDALEVFYLCVALGFRGRLGDNPTSLKKWGEKVYGRVVAGNKQPERFLPDEPRDPDRDPLRPLPGKSLLFQVSVWVSVTSLVTTAFFILASRLHSL